MIDFQLLRNEPEKIRAEIKKRFIKDINLEKLIALDEERRKAIAQLEEQRAEQKKASKEIAAAKGPDKKKKIAAAQKLAQEIKKLEPGVTDLESRFTGASALLPNFAHESVPVGATEKESKVASVSGEKPHFDFPVKSHWQLAEQQGLIDGKRAARLSGARFNYIKGDLVMLEFALLQFALDELLQRGFTPMLTPTLVKEEALYGAGTFPIDTKEVYSLPDDKLYLIGTSEITLLNYHAHETINLAAPLRYAGFTTNYRREAGAYGKEMHGLIRQHQFDKLEMFVYASQEESWEVFEELLTIAEGLLNKLGLHFRRLILSTGDLPRKFQKTYDLEVWLPSENRYLETHSISHAGDFQARRLGIKYVNKKGERRYAHTLNATAFAFSRMPVVILENFQQADGTIRIPEVLQPYLNNREFIGGPTKQSR
jgi:seryl-tRNA synthetase